MNQDKIDKAVLEIYRRLYKEATPSADFDKLMESGEVKEEGFFNNYELSLDRQSEIINEVLNKFKIRKTIMRNGIRNGILLGASPKSSFEKPDVRPKE